jgi:hypothetical protein
MNTLFEGLDPEDLKRLVTPLMGIDLFKSKLGEDSDICVLSIPVKGENPAKDLCNFIEKGYDWVIDADISSGELSNNRYIVFVEMERRKDIPEQILHMIDDMKNITCQTKKDWMFRYGKDEKSYPMTLKLLREKIPESPHAYRLLKNQLDALKHSAGLNIDDSTNSKKDDIEGLKWLSGLK